MTTRTRLALAAILFALLAAALSIYVAFMPSPLDADSPNWIAMAAAIAAVIAAAFAGVDRFWGGPVGPQTRTV